MPIDRCVLPCLLSTIPLLPPHKPNQSPLKKTTPKTQIREEFEAGEVRLQALNPLLRAVRHQLGSVQHELFFGQADVSGPLLDGGCGFCGGCRVSLG